MFAYKPKEVLCFVIMSWVFPPVPHGVVKVEISYYYLNIAHISSQNFSNERDCALFRIGWGVIYVMHVYLVFVPSICTGDGNGDQVRGMKTGGPFGIIDPFVYKKACPCV